MPVPIWFKFSPTEGKPTTLAEVLHKAQDLIQAIEICVEITSFVMTLKIREEKKGTT